MDPNDHGRDGDDPSSSQRPSRRIRGPYKTYLLDPRKAVPESTIRSRSRAAGERPPGSAQPLPPGGGGNNSPPSTDDESENNQNLPGSGGNNSPPGTDDESENNQNPPGNSGDNSPPGTTDESENNHNLIDGDNTDGVCDADDDPVKKTEKLRAFIQKHGLNDRLRGGNDSTCTKLEALLMILHMAYRHCNTQHFIEDQIKFVNALFGSNVLDTSYYVYRKLFQSSSEKIFHYFCPSCEVVVRSSKTSSKEIKLVKCQKCGKDIDVHSFDSGNYFVTISLKSQIESVLSTPGLKLIELDGRDPDLIMDVCDGEIYKSCMQPGGPFYGKKFFTVTFNTDGVSVFESTTNSMWPFLLYINEISPEQRLRIPNLILGGLWFGRSAPNMALFMKPILEDLCTLSEEGVNYVEADGSIVKCPVFGTIGSFDAVAKCKCVCQKQYNGRKACLYCGHPNDDTDSNVDDPHSNRLQRYYGTAVSYPLRTEKEVILDMFEADTLHRANQLGSGSVNGFLGLSVLLLLVTKYSKLFPGYTVFSIVWGVVIDYLHGALEGVMEDLLELFESTLTAAQKKTLNERLLGIKKPERMSWKPRFLDRAHWKAKEYRAFLLYFGLPCLEDLLPPNLFSNFKIFSRACFILLSDCITKRDLEEARANLIKFARDFEKLYGLSKVTYNLHVTTHYVDLVERMGPLWPYSNFLFESGNGHLLKLIRGTRSVVHEVAVKFCTLQSVNNIIALNPVSENALNFCSDLMSVAKYSEKGQRFGDVVVTGPYSYVNVDDAEFQLLQSHNVAVSIENRKVKYFHRAIWKGVVFCSRLYSEDKVFDDSCVMLEDSTYAVIEKLVVSVTDTLICVVRSIRIAPNDLVPNIKRCCFDVFDDFKLIPFSTVSRKCVFLSVSDRSYVCHIPNFYERD